MAGVEFGSTSQYYTETEHINISSSTLVTSRQSKSERWGTAFPHHLFSASVVPYLDSNVKR